MITLVVLVLLLVVVDRVAVQVAAGVIASKVQKSQNLDQKPSVSIEGFPFLTQVIGNDYHSIRLSGHDVRVTADGTEVRLDSFKGQLTNVKTADHFHAVTAEKGTGTANLGYTELSRLVGSTVGYGTNGRVSATRTLTVDGQSLTGTVTAKVSVTDGDALSFADVQVSVQGVSQTVPQSVTDQFTNIFARRLSLSGLPFGLKITQVTATSTGVGVSATATNITLR